MIFPTKSFSDKRSCEAFSSKLFCLGKTLSSILIPAIPAFSYFFTKCRTLSGPPYPVSQSAMTGMLHA